MRKHFLMLLMGTLVAVIPVQRLAAGPVTIGTIGSWDGSSEVNDFGAGGTWTYGQTITAPSPADLTSFSFLISEQTGGSFYASAFVYAWDATNSPGQATGSPLYQSASTLISGIDYNTYTFNTGGVALTPGDQYVLLLTVSDSADVDLNGDSSEDTNWASTDASTYSGGRYEYINNNGSGLFDEINSQTWDSPYIDANTAFSATFGGGAVPEPATWSFMLAGLLGLAGFKRFRKA